MYFTDFTNLAIPDPLANLADAVSRVALVTHLGGHTMFGCQPSQQTWFVHGVCQRFLAIHVFAQWQCRSGNDGMGMVGCGYHDTVDGVTHFVKHFTPVPVTFGLRKILEATIGIFPVHVAKTNYIFSSHSLQVGVAFTPYTNTDNIHFIARGTVPEPAYYNIGDNWNPRSGQGRLF